MTVSRQYLLKRRPEGRPDADCWDYREHELPDLAEGEVLVRVDFISLDPAMRGWMDERESYAPPVALGNCPDGVDVYFDNVGGETLEAALANLAMRARIVICGAISRYNDRESAPGPSNYLMLLVRRARMEGMLVGDYADRYDEALPTLAKWLDEGSLKAREHVVEGLRTFPETFLMLFDGDNRGKLVLKVGH